MQYGAQWSLADKYSWNSDAWEYVCVGLCMYVSVCVCVRMSGRMVWMFALQTIVNEFESSWDPSLMLLILVGSLSESLPHNCSAHRSTIDQWLWLLINTEMMMVVIMVRRIGGDFTIPDALYFVSFYHCMDLVYLVKKYNGRPNWVSSPDTHIVIGF